MYPPQARYQRRADEPLFNSSWFYTFRNQEHPDEYLSAGTNEDLSGRVSMTGEYASANWQIFSQSGLYFIRNYERGASKQLGFTAASNTAPLLYGKNGSIGQQWQITKVGDLYRFENALSDVGAVLAVEAGTASPGMKSGTRGGLWNVTMNPSDLTMQRTSQDAEWLKPLPSIESTPSPTPTPSSSSSPTNTLLPSSTNTSSPSPTTLPPTASSSSALSGGAIAGIAIGAILLITAVALALWFFLKKRKSRQPTNAAAELPGPYPAHTEVPGVMSEKYAHRIELAHVPVYAPVELAGHEGPRAELDAGAQQRAR